MSSNFGNIKYPSIQIIHTKTPHSYSVMITNGIMLYKLYEFFQASLVCIIMFNTYKYYLIYYKTK